MPCPKCGAPLYNYNAACVCAVSTDRPVSELERLRAAVEFCRMRLKRDAYRDTLDAILRGDKDEFIRNPDFTPMVAS